MNKILKVACSAAVMSGLAFLWGWIVLHGWAQDSGGGNPGPKPNLLAAGDAPKGDQKTIQGTWKVVMIEDGGRKRDVGDKKVSFGKTKITFKDGERTLGDGTFELDPTKKPKWIDVTQRGNKMLGIYELEGDNLKVCYNEVPGGERSTEFVSKNGTPNDVLIILKREKP
jgi:uncharacterized protein (TIGR03067 family)